MIAGILIGAGAIVVLGIIAGLIGLVDFTLSHWDS